MSTINPKQVEGMQDMLDDVEYIKEFLRIFLGEEEPAEESK